jgi:hypothetical protein
MFARGQDETHAFSTPPRHIFSSQRFPRFPKFVAVITSLLLASPPQGEQRRGGDDELVIIPHLHAKHGTGVASVGAELFVDADRGDHRSRNAIVEHR